MFETIAERIVDSLAERNYAVTDDFLSLNELERLQQELHRQFDDGAFKPAGIGQGQQYQQHGGVRGDWIRWIDREHLAADCHFILERMEAFAEYLNRTCYLGIRKSEFHFAMYPAGTFYKRHLDVFRNSNTRKISVVCYLNQNWKPEYGGQIRLYVPDENGIETSVDVLPLGGRMVCFKSDVLEHEVLPGTQTRLSLTGWLRSDD